MEELTASQLVIYENDAVLVSYTNGAGLQLAPCGSVFTYHHPLRDGDHPLHGQKKILQRTKFVTSTFRESVLEALDFRNRFAFRPYLLKDLIPSSNLTKLRADVCEITWPEQLHKANIKSLKDGSLTVTSMCNLAKLTLASSKQLCTVEYLCLISQIQEKPKWSVPKKESNEIVNDYKQPDNRVDRMFKYCIQSTSKSNQNSTTTLSKEQEGHLIEGRWDYAWVTQHFSLQDCPDMWQHPLTLALEAVQKQRGVKFEGDHESVRLIELDNIHKIEASDINHFQNPHMIEDSTGFQNYDTSRNEDNPEIARNQISIEHVNSRETLTNCVLCTITKSLPQNCLSSHLHKWGSTEFWDTEEKLTESAFVNGKIKVVCTRGVIYRFIWCQPKAIEIYPGDGTVIRSSGLSGHFFTHYIYNPTTGKVDEKMYSVTSPSPDIPGSKYSIARLLKTGERFLRHLYEESLSSSSEMSAKYCCWKPQPSTQTIQEPLPNVMLEECVVPGVGKFTAYSSGRIRIVFSDRTALDMYADFSKRLGHCKHHSDDTVNEMPDLHSYQPRSQGAHRIQNTDLPVGVCKLMLPNGHFTNVILSRPDKYQKYVKAAQEWSAWVNSSPKERYSFYQDTLHDSTKTEEIDKELRKINCFNYILENTLLAQFETKGSEREKYLPSEQQMAEAALLDPSFNSGLLLTSASFQNHQAERIRPFEIQPRDNTASFHSSDQSYQSSVLSQQIGNKSMLNRFMPKHPQAEKMYRQSCNASYFPKDDRDGNSSSAGYRCRNDRDGNSSNSGYRSGKGNFDMKSVLGTSDVGHTRSPQNLGVDLDISQDAALNLSMVEHILKKTSQAVSDLDQFLNTNREVLAKNC